MKGCWFSFNNFNFNNFVVFALFEGKKKFSLRLTDDMNMLERIYNLAAYWRTIYVHHHIILPRVDVIFQVN